MIKTTILLSQNFLLFKNSNFIIANVLILFYYNSKNLQNSKINASGVTLINW